MMDDSMNKERMMDKTQESKLKIDDDKICEVAERISKNFEIPIDEATTIMKIGTANAIMLNRFRGVFDKKEE
jgi:hypothetical protein